MPRNLSTNAIASANALTTAEVWLYLLEIHPGGSETPMYIVNNTENITSDGQEYIAYPFELVLSTDDGEKLPEVSLTIDNVHRDLIDIIRTLEAPPVITIKLVLASSPSTIEIEISGLVLRKVTYDAYQISGSLLGDDILNRRHPEGTIDLSSGYLGLFR